MNRKTEGKSISALNAEYDVLLKEYMDAKAKKYDIMQLVRDLSKELGAAHTRLIKAKSTPEVPE